MRRPDPPGTVLVDRAPAPCRTSAARVCRRTPDAYDQRGNAPFRRAHGRRGDAATSLCPAGSAAKTDRANVPDEVYGEKQLRDWRDANSRGPTRRQVASRREGPDECRAAPSVSEKPQPAPGERPEGTGAERHNHPNRILGSELLSVLIPGSGVRHTFVETGLRDVIREHLHGTPIRVRRILSVGTRREKCLRVRLKWLTMRLTGPYCGR